jgi:hypothetical protein
MTKRIKCKIFYHYYNTEAYFVIHRGWSLQRFKSEAAHLLSISAGRIRCKNHMEKLMKDYEDLEEYWKYEEAILEIDDNNWYSPTFKPNTIESDNRTNSITLLFNDGRKTMDLRLLMEWRIQDIYSILFINDMIPTMNEDNYYFTCQG